MIQQVECYTLICDNCGANVFENAEYSGFGDEGYVKECAFESNWIEHENNDYCPNCYEFNDNDEVVIINKYLTSQELTIKDK